MTLHVTQLFKVYYFFSLVFYFTLKVGDSQFFLLKLQGLADAFILLRYPFESAEAIELNKKIFETIYYGALTVSWTHHLVLSSSKREKCDRERNAQSRSWVMWISQKAIFRPITCLNWSEAGFQRALQTFIQHGQERIQQLPLHIYSAFFFLLWGLNYNVWEPQEIDFRLITTSKNNLSEIHIFWPVPYDSLFCAITQGWHSLEKSLNFRESP